MDRERLPNILLVLALTMAVAVPIIGGSLVPDYSHLENYISELGAVGTQWGSIISLGGFLPVGVLVVVFLLVSAPLVNCKGLAKVGYYLMFFLGFSYIGAAFAPCDIGCPAQGTIRQSIHNSLGIFEYVAGGIGLLLFASCDLYQSRHKLYKLALRVLGTTVLLAFFAMASPELSEWRGLTQRIAEFCMFGALIIVNRTALLRLSR